MHDRSNFLWLLIRLLVLLVFVGTSVIGRAQDTSSLVIVPQPTAMARKRILLNEISQLQHDRPRPTNVVILLADDLGYADIGRYGSKAIPTPHIDALAANGVMFSDAYVTAASCSPSRAGLLSGRYQQRFGFEFNTSGAAITHSKSRGLDPAVVTLADVFQRAGYRTAAIGKWHLGTREYFHPLRRGFDEFFGFLAGAHSFFPVENQKIFSTIMRDRTPLTETAYLTDAFAREAVKFIHQHKAKPFFLYVPFNAVHTPLEASQKYLDRFPTVRNTKQRAYNAMTSALDDAIGAIVQAIEHAGVADQTSILFLNDNGGPIYTQVQSNAPLRLGKLFLFEGGIRVPMVWAWPGKIEAGTVYGKPVSSLDVFPTVCAAAGIEFPKRLALDGVDLLPYVNGRLSSPPHEHLFWSNGPNKAVRSGDWKLIVVGKHRFLFHLANDIGEQTNLAKNRPDVVRKLESLLKDWQSQMAPPAWPSKPNKRRVEVDGVPYELNI